MKKKKKKVLSFLYREVMKDNLAVKIWIYHLLLFVELDLEIIPEYHTSDDNLKLISEKNLKKSLKFVIKIINEIQNNKIFIKIKTANPS